MMKIVLWGLNILCVAITELDIPLPNNKIIIGGFYLLCIILNIVFLMNHFSDSVISTIITCGFIFIQGYRLFRTITSD